MWNYYSDGVNDSANENIDAMKIAMNNNKTKRGQPFDYKKKLIGSTPNNKSRLNAEVVVLLIYFSNFWRSLDLLLTTVTAKKKKKKFSLKDFSSKYDRIHRKQRIFSHLLKKYLMENFIFGAMSEIELTWYGQKVV